MITTKPCTRHSPDIPEALIDALSQVHRLVVFSGLGMSAESDIPTFRDGMHGLWAHAASPCPELFHWSSSVRRCHHAITQNVDDLHGSLFAPRCSVCGRPGDFAGLPPWSLSIGWHHHAASTAGASCARAWCGLVKDYPWLFGTRLII